MKKKILIPIIIAAGLVYISSCYNNKEDIPAVQVSFRSQVVPIVTGGSCGCHNNENSSNAVQFSHLDTMFYDAILSRVSLFRTWVNGGSHPGGGVVSLTDREKLVLKGWIDQGGKDDANNDCNVSGVITYNINIVPIYNTTCKGGSCHGGGIAPVLDYNKMVADNAKLAAMMNSGGSSGHPGGTLSLSSCTIKIFKAWLAQGQPQ